MEEADAWQVLRGLLQGLAHIHAQASGRAALLGGGANHGLGVVTRKWGRHAWVSAAAVLPSSLQPSPRLPGSAPLGGNSCISSRLCKP